MKTRIIIFFILLICVISASWLALSPSTIAREMKWPERGADPYPWAKGTDGYTIIESRFKSASTAPLGSQNDIPLIQRAITAHMKRLDVKIGEIRWFSTSLVMISCSWYTGPLAAASYYYVVEKQQGNWKVKTYYMLSIS